MDEGTRLGLRAILCGLRDAGVLGDHALTVMVDELRYAARDAAERLYDSDSKTLTRLASELRNSDREVTPLPVRRAEGLAQTAPRRV
jgi:hypothetical protein